MPLARDNSDLPPARPKNYPLPADQQLIARPTADRWWNDYRNGPDFKRDRAMPELPLRASAVSLRCDRAFWYSLAGVEETNPSGPAGVFRMRLGQIVHAEIGADKQEVDDEGRKHGWYEEEVVDLRPAGFPGSAHGDLVRYDHGVPIEVGEIKTTGGFAFKLMASKFKGEPDGPKWEHCMQAAMVAVAIGARGIRIAYFSMENLAPDIAANVGADEYGKFCAEWYFDLDECWPGRRTTFREDLEQEAARQIRLLRLAQPPDGRAQYMPERTLDHPDYPPGAVVDIVDKPVGKGTWVTYSPANGTKIKSGTTWMCGYCDWKDQCQYDGPGPGPVVVPVGITSDEDHGHSYGPDYSANHV
jgi:hypothetical protein